MEEKRAFLGRGLAFPVRIDPATGKLAMAVHEQDIRQAVEIILGTSVGERVMRPGFGSRVKDYLFAEGSQETGFALEREITEALVKWEPRIQDVTVQVSFAQSRARAAADISYTVRATNNQFNLVYPFYLMEGEGMEGLER